MDCLNDDRDILHLDYISLYQRMNSNEVDSYFRENLPLAILIYPKFTLFLPLNYMASLIYLSKKSENSKELTCKLANCIQ